MNSSSSRRSSIDRSSETNTVVLMNEQASQNAAAAVLPNHIISSELDNHSQLSFQQHSPCYSPQAMMYQPPPTSYHEFGYPALYYPPPPPSVGSSKPDVVVPMTQRYSQYQHSQQHHHHSQQQQQPQFMVPMLRERMPKPMPPFDKCPVVFSLLSLCLCPITCCCSLPAFVFSMCSYVDHRVKDADRFRINSDHAKRLIIVACVLGLLLIVIWSIFIYLYKDSVVSGLSEHFKLLNTQVAG